MRGSRSVIGLLFIAALACTPQTGRPPSRSSPIPQPDPADQPVTDLASLVERSEAAGSTVEPGQRSGTNFLSRFLEVPGRGVLLDGEPISVYEFPSVGALRAMRSTISWRGDTVGSAIISWDPPRFYSAGRLLVVYFGEDPRTLHVLRGLLGPKFAGG